VFRTAAHFLAISAGFLAWCAGAWLFAASTLFAVFAEKVKPHSAHSNCWAFALNKVWRHGGYLLTRTADGVKFLGVLPVPHVAWVKTLGAETELQFFKPVARKSARWMPWFAVYYKGVISTKERAHNAH
jgi:LmbE family N-acetylglucosaminyl deacetylase